LIDEQSAEEPGASADPSAEAGIAANRAKDRTGSGPGGSAGQRPLLGGVMSAQATSGSASAPSQKSFFMRFLRIELA
jgi:hypothetical protein